METLPYRNPELPIDTRVDDLMGRMTLEEKVGQLTQRNANLPPEEIVDRLAAGSVLHCQGERAAAFIDAAAETRLGIPLLIGDDCIHGHSFFPGATIFPSQLAMSSSWNRELLEDVARATAHEVSCTGVAWTFSPVLCLPRDLRWGRVNETFGEDPYLIGELALAMIRGYQGKGLDDPEGILATAKHYAGYSETQGGRDASEADISRRKLKSYFLPPFEKAARNGCRAFMTGYQSMDGVPSTANRWLLRETLKEEWGFDGVLVTDWDNVGRMVTEQKICKDHAEAATLAIRAGNDLMMQTPDFREGAIEAVQNGVLDEAEIDEVCRRILRLKFEMGLFENPRRPDQARQKAVIGCEEHRKLNLEAARQSLILLRNDDGLLPLNGHEPKKLALIGTNADHPQNQLGDWAGGSGQVGWIKGGHPRECTVTLLDGLRERLPDGWSLAYAAGCPIQEVDESGIPEAVEVVKASDLAIMVVGDNLKLTGETRSTATLELQGSQAKLLGEIRKTGKPVVLVVLSGKPQVLPRDWQGHGTLVQAFNPGMQGGRAFAGMLFGDFNPSGKLTIGIPVHVGQQPICYAQVRGQHGYDYADLPRDPLFTFGEGRSYTSYAYANLTLAATDLQLGDVLNVSVEVTNTGDRAGEEIVQAYVSDLVTSATWVQKELKAFARVPIEPGETKTVTLEIPVAELSLVDAAGNRVVEAGEFEVQVGPSAKDADLLAARFHVRV